MNTEKENRPLLRPAVGEEDFASFREKGLYYADKTGYLNPLLEDTHRLMLLRPRRFGKTLMLSTLRHFLELNYDNPGDTARQQELFRGLQVLEDRWFCDKHMGQHPVLSLSFRNVDGLTFDEAYERLAGVICGLVKDFLWLDGPQLSKYERDPLHSIADQDYMRTSDARVDAEFSLSFLSRLLVERFGESHRTVILVDDFDVPLRNAAAHGYYRQMSILLGGMFGSVVKTNSDIEKVILAGCLMNTDGEFLEPINNMEEETVLAQSSSLSAAFGFTPEEAKAMFEYCGFGNCYDTARSRFGFYSIGGQELLCPWDICSYIDELSRTEDTCSLNPGPYWAMTGSRRIIAEQMPHLTTEDSERIGELISGKNVRLEADIGIRYNSLSGDCLNSYMFWDILLHAGYLTLAGRESYNEVDVRIPNEAITGYFRREIESYYEGAVSDEFRTSAVSFTEALLSGDMRKANISLDDLFRGFVALGEPGSEDSGGSCCHEFMERVLSAAGSDISNLRFGNGSGPAYITFSSADGAKTVVIGIECVPEARNWLDNLLNHAVKKSEENGYAGAFSNEFTGSVLQCGIAFRNRDCAVAIRELHSEPRQH